MSIVVKLPSASGQRERRLHLREVNEEKPAATTGALLRDRRIELGLDEKAIASKLKMRADLVRAIERGDYEKLPARTYAIGFVRSYAKFLGMDSAALVERFKDELQPLEISKPSELNFPEVPQARRLPSGQLLVVALVIAVVIYGAAQITMPSPESIPSTDREAGSVTVVDAPVASTPVASKLVQAPRVVDAAPKVEPIFPVIADDPSVTARLTSVLASPLSAPAATSASDAVTVRESAPGASRITLKALEETYVQVKDLALKKPQAILLARVMSPGESFQAPNRAGLVLLTGNAGGIQVEVDGRSVGVLGKSGQVIKRLPLEPAYFLSRISTSQ